MARCVALATYQGSPDFSASDRHLVAALETAGARVSAVPWDAEATDWGAFEAVVVRSTWDYHRKPERFRDWIELVSASGTRLLNHPGYLRWNKNKRYLGSLAAAGIPVPETRFVEPGDDRILAEVLAEARWAEAVVKPTVGASASGVWKLAAVEATERETQFREELGNGPLMVQRFLPEIAVGEWSLMFFAGEFGHAVLKVPAANDLRVQARYGGRSGASAAPAELIGQASRVLDSAADILVLRREQMAYARVDGVVVDGVFVLMELELVEPGLFLDLDTTGRSAKRFADAILRGS
jgi:glutathione synthase/RimK-type ligase-like ATP-grasp enzyme